MKQHKFSLLKVLFFLIVAITSSLYSNAQQIVTVAKDGTGMYSTISLAIKNYPATGITPANPYVIMVGPGIYFEKDTIASTQTNVQIIGSSVATTILTFNVADRTC